MTGTNAKTLRTLIDLVLAGRIEEACTRFHPDVVVHEADGLPYPGIFKGPSGFVELLQRVHAVVDLKIEHTALFDAGDTVVARMRTSLTSRASGESIEMPITEIYTFTPDGRISYVDVFYKDTAAVASLVAAEGAVR